MEYSLNVVLGGLTCIACKKLAENRISKIDGVSRVTINESNDKVEIMSKRLITILEIRTQLEGTPYQVTALV